MIPIKEVLSGALRSVHLDSLATLAEISGRWTEIMGEQLSQVTEPSHIAKKVLVISVFDNAFLEPLEYQKEVIRKRAVKEAGRKNIVDIRFQYRRKGGGA